jgi:hypothetical protein
VQKKIFSLLGGSSVDKGAIKGLTLGENIHVIYFFKHRISI